MKRSGARRTRAGKSSNDLERGRACYERRAWRDAHDHLVRADRSAPLSGDDLFRLAMCQGLFGDDEGMLASLERAHAAHREAGDAPKAARMAFWLGFRLSYLGETGRANGWWTRAERLLDADGGECAERGYLLIPV